MFLYAFLKLYFILYGLKISIYISVICIRYLYDAGNSGEYIDEIMNQDSLDFRSKGGMQTCMSSLRMDSSIEHTARSSRDRTTEK